MKTAMIWGGSGGIGKALTAQLVSDDWDVIAIGRQVILVRPGAVATSFWDKVPMRLPKNAATPEKVAERIVTAHAEGYEGVLDLV